MGIGGGGWRGGVRFETRVDIQIKWTALISNSTTEVERIMRNFRTGENCTFDHIDHKGI